MVNTAAVDLATNGLNDGVIARTPVADEVVESDIWQWRGRTLYFFNQRRGLQVIDATDPANPRKAATLRMPASGDQMYVLDDEHVLLLTGRVELPLGVGHFAQLGGHPCAVSRRRADRC